MREWEARMDRWFAKMNAAEQAFLKRILRQNGQPVDTVTVSANALYRAFMMGEGASDIAFLQDALWRRIRLPRLIRSRN